MKSLSLSKPHFIVAVGLPGSGKTFFAEKFAETFHAPYVSLHQIISYNVDEKTATSLFNYQLAQLAKTKQSIVIDGNADTRSERAELNKLARSEGYDVLLVWVQTDPATSKNRVLKEKSRSDDTYEKDVRKFAAPLAPEKTVVVSGKHTYASQAKVVLKKLTAPRAEISTHSAPPVREPSGRRNITIR